MNSYVTFFMLLAAVMVSMSAVSGQTFQYSRGWTNGKRSGSSDMDIRQLDKILSNPCLLEKLQYLVDGKSINDKLPCDMQEPALYRLRRSAPIYEPRPQENPFNFV